MAAINRLQRFHKFILPILILQIVIQLALVNIAYATAADELLKAAKIGDNSTVQRLLSQGANVNAKDKDGYTALIWASEEGRVNVVQTLLDRGADVNAKENRYGVNALMLASYRGHTDVVRALLERGADINAKDLETGDTALMAASEQGHTDVVQVLLANGAEVNVKDTNGETALSLATRKGYDEIVKLLHQHGTVKNSVKDDKAGFSIPEIQPSTTPCKSPLVSGTGAAFVSAADIAKLYCNYVASMNVAQVGDLLILGTKQPGDQLLFELGTRNSIIPAGVGAIYRFHGTVAGFFPGYTFRAIDNHPLIFKMTRDKGLKYIEGKGYVDMRDGTTITLGQ